VKGQVSIFTLYVISQYVVVFEEPAAADHQMVQTAQPSGLKTFGQTSL
jgi:hypothetical protein